MCAACGKLDWILDWILDSIILCNWAVQAWCNCTCVSLFVCVCVCVCACACVCVYLWCNIVMYGHSMAVNQPVIMFLYIKECIKPLMLCD